MGNGTTATLGECFEIPGRGVVIVLTNLDGTVNIGDRLEINDFFVTVKGVEMINYGSRQPDPKMSGIGVIVSGNKSEYTKRLGTKILVRNSS